MTFLALHSPPSLKIGPSFSQFCEGNIRKESCLWRCVVSGGRFGGVQECFPVVVQPTMMRVSLYHLFDLSFSSQCQCCRFSRVFFFFCRCGVHCLVTVEDALTLVLINFVWRLMCIYLDCILIFPLDNCAKREIYFAYLPNIYTSCRQIFIVEMYWGEVQMPRLLCWTFCTDIHRCVEHVVCLHKFNVFCPFSVYLPCVEYTWMVCILCS
jgi:hypothetical protein